MCNPPIVGGTAFSGSGVGAGTRDGLEVFGGEPGIRAVFGAGVGGLEVWGGMKAFGGGMEAFGGCVFGAGVDGLEIWGGMKAFGGVAVEGGTEALGGCVFGAGVGGLEWGGMKAFGGLAVGVGTGALVGCTACCLEGAGTGASSGE